MISRSAEIGELTGTDVAQAQSSLEQAMAQRVATEGQLEISRADTSAESQGALICQFLDELFDLGVAER